MASLDNKRKQKLENLLVQGKLGEVTEAYVTDREIRVNIKIPRTGDTALHVAVSDGYEQYVEKMVRAAESDVLKIKNELGDTALHLAAKFGNAYLCKLIAKEEYSLVGERNNYGETPLFLAVTHGRTDAFRYLHHFYKDKPEFKTYEMFTKTRGDTILHSAISEQHFDIAYIIIEAYPALVHKINDDGLSPLHLLATKPSVFPSGLHLYGIQKLVFHCVRVKKLEKISDLSKSPDPQPQPFWKLDANQMKQFEQKFKPRNFQGEDTNPQGGHGEFEHDEEAAIAQDAPTPPPPPPMPPPPSSPPPPPPPPPSLSSLRWLLNSHAPPP